MSQLKAELRQFIIDNFLFGDVPSDFSDDISFLDKGIIDSTGVLEVVAFLESTYEISVEDEELVPENFDSVNNLAGYVCRKTGKEDG
jgi:acyl carrier protein